MGPEGELQLLTSAIHQAIGRNLVLLQEMESVLRGMVIQSELSGPASQLEKLKKQRAKRLGKASLGMLVDRFTREILADPSAAANNDFAGIDEPHVSFKINLSQDAETATRRRQALKRIVQERNKLVHRVLADWNKKSIEASREFLQRLEVQFQESSRELEVIETLRKVFTDSVEEMVALAKSGQLQRLLMEMMALDANEGRQGESESDPT